MSEPTGVVLLTFGSAVTSADVPTYLASVRGGRAPSDEVLAEFRRRYDVIGRSPLIDITRRQASALQAMLNADGGSRFLVRPGMLHSQPSVAAAVDAVAAEGARGLIGIVLAPQYSPIILAGYERAIEAARVAHPGLDIHLAGAWHALPEWIDSLAARVTTALAGVVADEPGAPVIFTAHSLPRAVVDRDPAYIEQLLATARTVAARAGLGAGRWQFAYQSAGHTPEPWLTPDVKDLLPELRARGVRTVLVVPVQFLADHLEVLYDLDVAARDEARALGIEMRRVEMPNASPELIRALAAVVMREVGSATW